MTVTEVKTLEEFRRLINRTDVESVFDFWATWCGPCRMISPTFVKLADQNASGGVKFYKVDADAAPDIVEEVGIKAMPTFQAYKGGKKLEEVVGALPNQVKALINNCVIRASHKK